LPYAKRDTTKDLLCLFESFAPKNYGLLKSKTTINQSP